MHHLIGRSTAMAGICAVALLTAPSAAADGVEVSPDSARPAALGPPDRFTGVVSSKPLFAANEYTETAGGEVSFESGARSAWHTHPAGQTLIISTGTGWVQEWGGPKQLMQTGDVVWTSPGVKHWHGATADTPVTHIAIQRVADGSAVTWMEQVSDSQYLS